MAYNELEVKTQSELCMFSANAPHVSGNWLGSVSYTHLTLPTIYSV